MQSITAALLKAYKLAHSFIGEYSQYRKMHTYIAEWSADQFRSDQLQVDLFTTELQKLASWQAELDKYVLHK